MNSEQKIKQYDDISFIQMKKKASTNSQNISNNHNLNPNMFKFTQSDLEDVDNKQSHTPQQSERQDQSKLHRKKHSIFNTKITQNETVIPELSKKTNIIKPDVRIQKKMSINLTNSIPMALTFFKNKSKTENTQQRKFRIFPQIQTIKFVLPNLDQYYTKVTTIKKQKQIQPNLIIQEPSQMSSTNNKQLNISASTFFGFGHNNDTKLKNPTDRPKKSFLQSKFVKSTKNDQKNAFNKYHDEIKQQQEDLENSQQLKDKLTNQKIIDYKSKGIYLLLGFLLSIIIMISIQKII